MMPTRAMNFKQFLLMNHDHPQFGSFAVQMTTDRNWFGVSPQSLHNHLRSINASPERLSDLIAAEEAWKVYSEGDR